MASSCQNDQGLGSRREVEVKATRRRKNSRSTARTPDQATPAKLTTNTIQYRRPKSSGDARAITEAARRVQKPAKSRMCDHLGLYAY
jgi:hypothetical protein